MALYAQGQYQEALTLGEKAVVIALSGGGKFGEVVGHRMWGWALAELAPQDTEQIDLHMVASITALEAGDAHLETARTEFVWGLICHKRRDFNAVRNHWIKAAAQFKASDLPGPLAQTEKLIADLSQLS